MHNLVADPTDTFAAARRQCNYGEISPACSTRQNGVATEVYTLQRIAPTLNVGCYLEAVCPTPSTLVTVVW